MSRYEYLRRKMRRMWRSREQKFMTIVYGFLAAAVVLVLVLSVAKIYSIVKHDRSQTADESENAVVSTAAVTAAAVDAMEQPSPEPTPREKAVALTFDDGPSRANTGTILEVLQTYGAHATFFVLGNRARVDGDILQMELAAGCEIGSHSWDHPQLNELPWKKVKSQLSRTDKIVKELTDGYKIKLIRPPYGAISDKMRENLNRPMILWSLDTLDWKLKDPVKVFKRIKKQVKDGDIILMHDIHAETAEAIKDIVPWLQEQGYDILTVSELAARNEKKLQAGKAYTDGKK